MQQTIDGRGGNCTKLLEEWFSIVSDRKIGPRAMEFFFCFDQPPEEGIDAKSKSSADSRDALKKSISDAESRIMELTSKLQCAEEVAANKDTDLEIAKARKEVLEVSYLILSM